MTPDASLVLPLVSAGSDGLWWPRIGGVADSDAAQNQRVVSRGASTDLVALLGFGS